MTMSSKNEYCFIKVTFYELGNEVPFIESTTPVEQLPDTFEIDTNVDIHEETWRVVCAKPAKKVEFRTTGEVKIYVEKYKVFEADPQKILYSVPTIDDCIAGVENCESLENVLIFSEDDWRQCEFISKNYGALIGHEIQEIANIYKNHHRGVGFDDIHLRTKISKPFAKDIPFGILKNYFDIDEEYSGVAFNTAVAKISGGFGLR